VQKRGNALDPALNCLAVRSASRLPHRRTVVSENSPMNVDNGLALNPHQGILATGIVTPLHVDRACHCPKR